jgi:hypothetical protein
MKPLINITLIAFLTVFFASCSKSPSNLKVVQEQTAGNTKVSLLSENGIVKHGSGEFYLEFANENNQPESASGVSVDAVMQMSGPPMEGETTVSSGDKTGQFEVKYTLGMRGNWRLNVTFNGSQQAQFIINVN